MNDGTLSIRVFDARSPVDRAPGWWAAKCRRCGEWLSKYDHSEQDAWRHALASKHECAIP